MQSFGFIAMVVPSAYTRTVKDTREGQNSGPNPQLQPLAAKLVDVLRYVDRNTSLLYKVRFSTSLHIVVYTVTMSKDIVANGKKLETVSE